jgi:hypothetical protein
MRWHLANRDSCCLLSWETPFLPTGTGVPGSNGYLFKYSLMRRSSRSRSRSPGRTKRSTKHRSPEASARAAIEENRRRELQLQLIAQEARIASLTATQAALTSQLLRRLEGTFHIADDSTIDGDGTGALHRFGGARKCVGTHAVATAESTGRAATTTVPIDWSTECRWWIEP